MADSLLTPSVSPPRYPLITERYAATPSESFSLSTESGFLLATLSAKGLSSGESIPIQIMADDETWSNASTIDPITFEEVPVQLAYGANTITLNGLGTYRVNKGVTALPTSVTLYR